MLQKILTTNKKANQKSLENIKKYKGESGKMTDHMRNFNSRKMVKINLILEKKCNSRKFYN